MFMLSSTVLPILTLFPYEYLRCGLLDLVHPVIGSDTKIGILELFEDIRAVE